MTRKQRSNHQTSPKYNYNAAPKCNSNTAKIYNIIEIQSRESAELQQDNEEEYNFNTAQITQNMDGCYLPNVFYLRTET